MDDKELAAAKERERKARARGFDSIEALDLYELEEALDAAKDEQHRVAAEVASIEEQIAEARADLYRT